MVVLFRKSLIGHVNLLITHMYVSVHTHTYIHTQPHTHTHMCTHTKTHTNARTYTPGPTNCTQMTTNIVWFSGDRKREREGGTVRLDVDRPAVCCGVAFCSDVLCFHMAEEQKAPGGSLIHHDPPSSHWLSIWSPCFSPLGLSPPSPHPEEI